MTLRAGFHSDLVTFYRASDLKGVSTWADGFHHLPCWMYIFFHKNEGVKSICISLISLSRKLRSASFSFFGLANEKTRVVKNSKLKIHRVFLIFSFLLSTLYKKIREKREVRGRKNIFEVSLSRYKWSRKFFSDNEIRCLSRNLWCPGRDLNSYTVRQRLLRPSCLPIPPPGRDMMNLEVLSSTNSTSWTDRNMVGRAGFEPAKS